MLAS
jgi:hypothetical protein